MISVLRPALLLGSLLLTTTASAQTAPGTNGAYPTSDPSPRAAATPAPGGGPDQADPGKGETKGPAPQSGPGSVLDDRDKNELLKGVRHELSSVGLRLSLTGVETRATDERGWGLTLASHGEMYRNLGLATARSSHLLAIGGGNQGFEGALDLSSAGGVRLPVGENHGPFARLGMRGWLWGNQLLYSSLLEIPQGQVGYQYIEGETVVEVGANAGPVLIGRYNAGDDARFKLGNSLEYGGYLTVHIPHVHLRGSIMRIDPGKNDARPSVDMARASLCFWPAGLAVCADGQWLRGDMGPTAAGAPGVDARSSYVGLLVGAQARE
ncbi:MAG: hypothetical protein EOO75_15320 [Myxococcales bacterium]|nr:MAG: hypothetical protein EOO75_15320 [Myxococcales bacterium]